MPLNEPDESDPMEFRGVALPGDTLEPMAEAFIEEFLGLGCDAARLLELFRRPEYRGPHAAWLAKGEAWVRERIENAIRLVPPMITTTREAGPEAFEV